MFVLYLETTCLFCGAVSRLGQWARGEFQFQWIHAALDECPLGLSSASGVQIGTHTISFPQNAAAFLKTHFRCSEANSQSWIGSRRFDGHEVKRGRICDGPRNASWAFQHRLQEYNYSPWPIQIGVGWVSNGLLISLR